VITGQERGASGELIADRLFVMGGTVPADGRMTWAPVGSRRHQPQNCFVLRDGGAMLVVDPGPAIVLTGVLAGLESQPPVDRSPLVFLTRYQLDGIGNLGPVAELLTPSAVYSGGVINPFDSFDQVGAAQGRDLSLTFTRITPGEPIDYGDCTFEVLPPLLRLLATYWGFDRATGTLFTSDSFTHGMVADPAARPVIDDLATDPTTLEDVRGHIHATFEWLDGANTAPIVEHLRRMFGEREVQVIAPDRGCVLQSREVVERHLELMIEALQDLGKVRG
jgi:flavorubredoxin